MNKSGKSMKTYIFNDRDRARIFLEDLLNEYAIIQPETLKNAIEAVRTSIFVDEIIVIYMKCNDEKEKNFFYEIKETDHRLLCVIT